MSIALKIGQWVEVENGYLSGPLFQQPNGQFTLGMQFITWSEDGSTDSYSSKDGYTIVKTYNEYPGELYDIAFYMNKFPAASRETARLARDTIVMAKEYTAKTKAIINAIGDEKLKQKLKKEWWDD